MLEKVETEEGSAMMGRAGTESEAKKRGLAVGIERGRGEETEIGIMLIEIEIMGEIEIGTEVDTVTEISSKSASGCVDYHAVLAFCGRISIALNSILKFGGSTSCNLINAHFTGHGPFLQPTVLMIFLVTRTSVCLRMSH